MKFCEDFTDAIWIEKGGSLWMNCEGASVREIATSMRDVRARFITITAYQLPENKGFRLEYHWDLKGRLLGFPFEISGKSIDSIYDVCEAADWVEREIFEGFAIEFTGRELQPLQLPAGKKPGVNLREEVAR